MTFAVSIAVQSLNFQLERPTKIVDFNAGISKVRSADWCYLARIAGPCLTLSERDGDGGDLISGTKKARLRVQPGLLVRKSVCLV